MSYIFFYYLMLDKKTGKWANITTKSLCDIMTNNTLGSELQRFVRVRNCLLWCQHFEILLLRNIFQQNNLKFIYPNLIIKVPRWVLNDSVNPDMLSPSSSSHVLSKLEYFCQDANKKNSIRQHTSTKFKYFLQRWKHLGARLD